MKNYDLIIQILMDLKRVGTFYQNAIELDYYCIDSITGEEFEKRIDTALKKTENEKTRRTRFT